MTHILWPRLNAKPDLFLVHRTLSIIPDLYMPPGEAEWLALYGLYPRMSVMRHQRAVTFDCPILQATPGQQSYWESLMPARPHPDGIWFGWGVELRGSSDWNRFIIRGRFVIAGQLAVGGKIDVFEHITSQDIETVTTHVVEFVDRLESVVLRPQSLTTVSS